MATMRNNAARRRTQKVKNWCWTINNPVEPLPVLKPSMLYITYGREVGESGTPHLQGYTQYKKPVLFNRFRADHGMDRVHGEPQRSRDNEKARDYCHKEDPAPFEAGTFKSNKGVRGDSTVKKRRDAYADVKRGLPIATLYDTYPEEVMYLNSITKLAPARKGVAKVLYLYGKTGCGKTTSTHKVLEELDLSWFKKMPKSHWFDGYLGQQVLFLEEFQSCFNCTTFLSMCDTYPPTLEIKGGAIANQSTHYIICSNKSPDEQYPNVQQQHYATWEAYRRRIDRTVCCTRLSHDQIEEEIRQFFRDYPPSTQEIATATTHSQSTTGVQDSDASGTESEGEGEESESQEEREGEEGESPAE